MLAAALLLATAAPVAQCHIYAVIHHVFVRPDGRISHVDVERVIDPAGPGTEAEVARRAVDVEVPPAYILAVRAVLERRPRSGIPPSFYTYTFFNPARPEAAEPDPAECAAPR
jgi:hypothetical protein